jgi:hypothetical protein
LLGVSSDQLSWEISAKQDLGGSHTSPTPLFKFLEEITQFEVP